MLGNLIRIIAGRLNISPGHLQIGLLTLAYLWIRFDGKLYGPFGVPDLIWIGISAAVVFVSGKMQEDWFKR